MGKYIIKGGNALKGEVTISGAKNAAVAILPAVIISDSTCIIENIPCIADVYAIVSILEEIGCKIKIINQSTIEIDPTNVTTHTIPHKLAKKMRASYYFLGAMLARLGKASVAMPGGCDFGVRPIDQHIKGFEALGATVTLEKGDIIANGEKLIGSTVYLDMVSVGATINVMLAACKARGLTIIENAAKEPHIVDLANFLNTMGANIMGAGTDVIKIHGVSELRGVTYSIIPDQIEAGTFMAAALATGGDILVKNVTPKHLESIAAKLEEAGATIEEFDDSVRVSGAEKIKKINLKTMPHPGFPTDMQPQMVAALACAGGTSIVTEGIWDNRFRYVDELARMGAKISVDGKVAVVEGVEELAGALVAATDLRAGAAMIIAGLCAKGETVIEEVKYIERGYDNIVEKLTKLGADIVYRQVIEGVSVKKAN